MAGGFAHPIAARDVFLLGTRPCSFTAVTELTVPCYECAGQL